MTPNAITFVPAGEADLASLTGFYLELVMDNGEAMTAAEAAIRLSRALRAGLRAVLIRHAGRDIGYASWYDLGDHVFVRHFMIGRAHRGAGLGALVFERLRSEALPPGAELRLEASGADARRFWTGRGFTAWSTGLLLAPAEDPC